MVYVPRRRRDRGFPMQAGDRVRVVAHVGGSDDDGRAFSVRGESGRVVGTPYRHAETGEKMVGVVLEDGAVISTPRRALKTEE